MPGGGCIGAGECSTTGDGRPGGCREAGGMGVLKWGAGATAGLHKGCRGV